MRCKRGIIIFLVSLIVCALLAGCAGAQGGRSTQPPATGAATAGTAQASQPAAGTTASAGAAGVGELSPDNPVTMDVFINFSWYPVSEWKGIIPEEITRRTGVTLNPTVAVDSQQLGLMIASGELPDLVATDGMLSNLSTSELCYDWQSLIDKYQTGWEIPQMNKANALSFTQEDDKFFTLLSHFSTTEEWKGLAEVGVGAAMTGSLHYRRDLYERMGSPPMETLDDIRNMLIMAHEKYPEITTLLFESENWVFTYFRECFGLGQLECHYIEDENGNWITCVKDPRYKAYCAYMNELFRAGCIQADNYALDQASQQAVLQAGNAFAWSQCTQGNAQKNTAELKKTLPDATFWEAPIVGDPAGFYNTSIGWMGTFISKNCDTPEAAIRYMQYLHSDGGAKLTQWGREGEEYTLDENGSPTFSQAWIDAQNEGQLDDLYNTWFYFGGSKILEAIARCAGFPEETVPNYVTLRGHFGNLPWCAYARPVEGTDEKVLYDKLFDKQGHLRPAEAKVIMSATEDEFEANFKELLTVAEAIGMNELESYMDGAIKAAMEVYGVAP